MVLFTMMHQHCEDDEVKERTGAGRVLAVILARTGCDARTGRPHGVVCTSHGRGNSKWRIRTSSGRMLAWLLYLQWRLPLDSPKGPMTPRLITGLSAKGSMRQQVLL